MSETKSIVDNYEKTQRASIMFCNDIIYSQISQLIEYRIKQVLAI